MRMGFRHYLFRAIATKPMKLSVWISLLLLSFSSEAIRSGDYSYEINPDHTNTVTITDYYGTGGEVVIPTNFNGLVVTSIGALSFNKTWGQRITIPNSVTNIEERAFLRGRLERIEIPDSVLSIGRFAFSYCEELKSIEIPPHVTTIADSCFRDCNALTNVVFRGEITTIESSAFSGCHSLRDVLIPETVTRIESYAFRDCDSLTNLWIPASVSDLDTPVFESCDNLQSIDVDSENLEYRSIDGVLYDDTLTRLYQYPCAKAGDFIVPDGIKYIYAGSFADARHLSDVTFPNSLVTINQSAFENCTGLTRVSIPENVSLIWDSAFRSCDNLEILDVDAGNDRYMSVDGVLFEKDPFTLLQCPAMRSGDYVVPDDVVTIQEKAFLSCSNITSVTLPESVADIEAWAFGNCVGLTDVQMPLSATLLGSSAFRECHSLRALSLPEGVTTIESYTFDDCHSLTNVVFPSSLATIENYAFVDCGTLKEVDFPDGLERIGTWAFRECHGISRVHIPASVTYMGPVVFSSCSNLLEITVDEANGNYTSVDGVLFSKDMTTLLEYPGGRTGHYDVPDEVTSIAMLAFDSGERVTSITFPETINEIQRDALYGCWSLNGLYFKGDAPIYSDYFSSLVTTYYLPTTEGWGTTFGSRPTRVWSPTIKITNNHGVQTNGFEFSISGTDDELVGVEACVDLRERNWESITTCTLEEGNFIFRDSSWTNQTGRFYRLSMP